MPITSDFTGTVQETGVGAGLDYNVNIPLPRGSTDDERYLSALDDAMKHVTTFKPRYLVVRCDFIITTMTR